MNREDYDKFYQKGGTYTMPTEIFNELFYEYECFRDDRNNLIKYLEDKIKELKEEISHFNLWHEAGTDLNYLILQKQWYEDILERIKNNNYD